MDRCIWDPYQYDVYELTKPVMQAIELADTLKQLDKERKKQIGKALFKWGLPLIIKEFRIPKHIATAMAAAYRPIEPPRGVVAYPDVSEIPPLTQKKILVTTGLKHFQEAKIKRLGLAPLFDEIIINTTDKLTEKRRKKVFFEAILERYGWKPNEVMVVGDKAEDELQSGKELGMITVQSLRPRIVEKVSGFNFYITSFAELPGIIEALEH